MRLSVNGYPTATVHASVLELKLHHSLRSTATVCYTHTDEVHWITSRQASPSPATRRNHSPASLSLHNSTSKDSSFLSSVACRLARIASAEMINGNVGERELSIGLEMIINQLLQWLRNFTRNLSFHHSGWTDVLCCLYPISPVKSSVLCLVD